MSLIARRRIAAAALVIALLLGGGVLAFGGAGHHDPQRRVSAPTSTTVRKPATTTTRATTTSRASTTTTTSPPVSALATTAAPTAPATVATTAPSAVPQANGSLAAVRGRTIAIDPGHNGGNYAHTSEISRPIFIGTQSRACDTTGTQTDDGYTESAYALDVSLRLRDVLQAAGANVIMSRTTDSGWGPCIDERAAFANRANAAVAISIHADGGPVSGRGFHVNMPADVAGYTDDIYAQSHQLGVDVRDALVSTGMPTSTYFGSQGLVERSDLGGLNLSNVPKVLVETGNMRNATDVGLLESADFREREAQAMASALARYLAGA
jgi:N-acetylmuramoyl-L-alanine amidase